MGDPARLQERRGESLGLSTRRQTLPSPVRRAPRGPGDLEASLPVYAGEPQAVELPGHPPFLRGEGGGQGSCQSIPNTCTYTVPRGFSVEEHGVFCQPVGGPDVMPLKVFGGSFLRYLSPRFSHSRR